VKRKAQAKNNSLDSQEPTFTFLVAAEQSEAALCSLWQERLKPRMMKIPQLRSGRRLWLLLSGIEDCRGLRPRNDLS
jgi:hypothetical protein